MNHEGKSELKHVIVSFSYHQLSWVIPISQFSINLHQIKLSFVTQNQYKYVLPPEVLNWLIDLCTPRIIALPFVTQSGAAQESDGNLKMDSPCKYDILHL